MALGTLFLRVSQQASWQRETDVQVPDKGIDRNAGGPQVLLGKSPRCGWQTLNDRLKERGSRGRAYEM